MRASRVAGIDISGIRKMFELAGEDTVNLALGEPDFPIPEEAKKAIYDAVEQDFTHYTSNNGILELREAITQKLKKENGIEAEADEIIVTSGASEALHLAFQAFVESGDEVLLPNPGFVSYEPLTRIAGGKPVFYSQRFERGFLPDIDEIQEKISRKTKMIVINSPCNPTGGVLPVEIVKAIGEIAQDRKILVLSDEVYEYIIYEGEHHSVAKYCDYAITVNGFSKSYAMTGLRIGYVHAEKSFAEEMLKVHQYIQACASSIAQKAALGAMHSQGFVERMVQEFNRRRELAWRMLSEIPGVRVKKPEGAFYIFADFSSYGNDKQLAIELAKAGVVLTPGSAFGSLGEGFLRLSFACGEQKIKEGITRIKSYLEARQ